jgi:16S rRNA (uracil1498-N3)-methyltransferase
VNLILLFQEDFIEGNSLVRLQGRRLRHVIEVHRAVVGDELCVGVLGGRIGTGKVTSLSQSALEMEVKLDRLPPPKLPLTLILALPRPKVIRRVLRSASTMGVPRIILLNCSRVEKSFWQSPLLSDTSVREQLILGLEQARDTVPPEVMLKPLFKPFVEDELPCLASGSLSLVAHPGAAEPCPRDVRQATALAIGPEGGFIPYEIEKLVARGFQPVRISDRILSVETAVPALISRLF